jgi:hypothetical protein
MNWACAACNTKSLVSSGTRVFNIEVERMGHNVTQQPPRGYPAFITKLRKNVLLAHNRIVGARSIGAGSVVAPDLDGCYEQD